MSSHAGRHDQESESVQASKPTKSKTFQDHLESAQAAGGAMMDRRSGLDRRLDPACQQVHGAEMETGLERRRGVGRRRSDWARAAEEGEMTKEQFLFIKAIEAFKIANNVMYPTWTDILEVVRLLGYRKTMNTELSIPGAEDFTESPQALSGVRAKPGHPEARSSDRHRDVA